MTDVTRHGAYLCLRVPPAGRPSAAGAAVPELVADLGLTSEYDAVNGHPADAVAFVRRAAASPGVLADDSLLHADAVVHVASASEATVARFCADLPALLGPDVTMRVIGGVARPTNYTGNAMQRFAYDAQLPQQPGAVAPNAFLLPLSKTAAWWSKDWMERHTYFLPRYEDGVRRTDGHVLAAAPGVEILMRRTYKQRTEPAPDGTYDFVNYFECADADVPGFHAVCAALRDVDRNPEWAFVREGPLWHGRRVATWGELFA